ncbi:MAG: hypothetical protein AAFV95_00450 [Bacteroidota bacterium]
MIQAEDGIKGSEEDPAVLYKSSDLGTNWTPFAKGIPKEATVSGIKQAGEKVYISTDYHGVFVISDGQDAWTSLQIDVPMGLDINCIEVEKDRILIGTFGHGVFLSTDGGSTWKRPAQNIVDVPIRAFAKSGARLYAGTDAGIYESVDLGNTWSPVFGKLQILGFTSLNGKLYAAAQNGALLCEGEPSNWKYIYEGDALHDIGNDGEYIYAMTIGQRLLKTKNDGVSWEAAQNGIAWPTNYYTNELQHIGTDVFSAQWIGVYHSSDHGNNWRILNGLPDSTAFSTLEVTDMGMMAGISIR